MTSYAMLQSHASTAQRACAHFWHVHRSLLPPLKKCFTTFKEISCDHSSWKYVFLIEYDRNDGHLHANSLYVRYDDVEVRRFLWLHSNQIIPHNKHSYKSIPIHNNSNSKTYINLKSTYSPQECCSRRQQKYIKKSTTNLYITPKV